MSKLYIELWYGHLTTLDWPQLYGVRADPDSGVKNAPLSQWQMCSDKQESYACTFNNNHRLKNFT